MWKRRNLNHVHSKILLADGSVYYTNDGEAVYVCYYCVFVRRQ
jgi:hypothetical protein